jgi:hypothetical protein
MKNKHPTLLKKLKQNLAHYMPGEHVGKSACDRLDARQISRGKSYKPKISA